MLVDTAGGDQLFGSHGIASTGESVIAEQRAHRLVEKMHRFASIE
jgi:hypothetical protein